MAGNFGTVQPSSMDVHEERIQYVEFVDSRAPGYPGKCLDVYLRHLIEELKFLWNVGHPTYDKY